MTHIFDPKHFIKLDNPKRKEAMQPDLVCELLELTKDMSIADVGCGIGFFSFPFAEIAKRVQAVDISSIMTNELTNRIKDRLGEESNIEVILGDFHTLIPNTSLDLFFTSTVIHELPDLDAFSTSAVEKLNVGGRLAYMDFEKIDSDFGPPKNKRIASESVIELFEKIGLKEITHHKVNENFYLVVGTKPC